MQQDPSGLHPQTDIYECEPWNLLPPDEFKRGPSGNQAFFFTPRHPAAGSSSKSNKPHARRTVRGGGGGFWHGNAHEIHIRWLGKSGGGPIVGRKTSLNFKTRDGIPTGWMMQEYLLGSGSAGNNLFQSVALCKIYRKLLHGRRRDVDIDHLQEPPPCYKKQPRVLEIAKAADDGLPPPCKKQRRNDLQVVEGFADFSTCRLPSSSSSEDLITTSRGGGQQYAATFASGQGSALNPIAASEDEEEVAAVHSATASNDFEMFNFTQLMGEEVPVLPAEATADHSHNDERFTSLSALLFGEEEEKEMALPAAANELFTSFSQLLEGDKEKVGVLPAEAAAAADCSHDDQRFASLATQLLGEEEKEEMALPAVANKFASFTQLLEGDKKEEQEVVVVLSTPYNDEEAFHTQFFWDEYMLTQYDDFCIDDYLCLENYPN